MPEGRGKVKVEDVLAGIAITASVLWGLYRLWKLISRGGRRG